MNSGGRLPASFRDPSGFLFQRGGCLYRQVNLAYREHYDRLMESGLYQDLVDAKLLIPHQETDVEPADPAIAYKVIQPVPLPFVSYPYEWCFLQLKDAALATLKIQRLAMAHGMTLKDSSSYNIGFYRANPVLIDSLSFEIYETGEPWVAYQQFCQHFLAPLALMAITDVRLGQLLRIHIDGIPLDLTSRLLPLKTWLRFSLLAHVHLHAITQKRYAEATSRRNQIQRKRTVSRRNLLALIDNLERGLRRLKWHATGTEWADYYERDHNYESEAMAHKRRLVDDYIGHINPSTVWDLGSNTGVFSRLASNRGITTVAFDVDPAAVQKNYQVCRQNQEENLLPLLVDLTNPSSHLGWHSLERDSWIARAPGDTVLALALVHHLAISNHVPFDLLADFFLDICRWLIIEFVPITDPQVERLLTWRSTVESYTQEEFERSFCRSFKMHREDDIPSSERTLYLFEAK